MPVNSLLQTLQKIGKLVFNFFKKEEENKKEGKQIVADAMKESDEEKITELKNKINQL